MTELPAQRRQTQRASLQDVSVIIPAYNRACSLEQAILSVLGTAGSDVEVVVCDDGSTDDTPQLMLDYVNRYPTSVRYLRLPHGGLPAVARNQGILSSTRPLIAFLDSDDTWLPGKLQGQLGVLNSHPNVGLVCTNALRRYVLQSGDVEISKFFDEMLPEFPLSTDLVERNTVITSSVVVRRSILNVTGLFSESCGFRAVEDWDLWLRVALLSEVAYLSEPFVEYADDATQSIRYEQKLSDTWRGLNRVLQSYADFARQERRLSNELSSVLRAQAVRQQGALLTALLREGRWFDFGSESAKLMLYHPIYGSVAAIRMLRLKMSRALARIGYRFRSVNEQPV